MLLSFETRILSSSDFGHISLLMLYVVGRLHIIISNKTFFPPR